MINYSGKKYVVTFLTQRNMDLKFFLNFQNQNKQNCKKYI